MEFVNERLADLDFDPGNKLFSPRERTKSSLPYLSKFQIQHATSARLPTEDKLMKDWKMANLQWFTQRENAKVDFYLELLGKTEAQQELARISEREREREKDEERRIAFENLFSQESSKERVPKKETVKEMLTSRVVLPPPEPDDDEMETKQLYIPKHSKSIAADLEQRINELRKDPVKRAEFEERIGLDCNEHLLTFQLNGRKNDMYRILG
jgi:hypothetical protein